MQLPTPRLDSASSIGARRGAITGPTAATTSACKVDMFINRFLNGQPYMCRMIDISRTGIRLAPMLEPDGRPVSELHGAAVPASGSERHPDGVGRRDHA